jgi:putative membrane-bound dehydrogenase-like protein
MTHQSYGALLAILAIASSTLADGPAPAEQAAQRFTLPPGFQAALFAGEPDVVQPIAFTFDDRGRLWVVENHSYPGWAGEKKDRVIILEDRDGDGRFDERKVFLDEGSNLSGIEWGWGGVWLCSTPNLVFVPDRNADDVPDSEPVIKLDGWDLRAQHNVSSSLAWGPDGWLYGCNGILSNSSVGRPGAAPAERTSINCGVWRYHPEREVFEVVARGTTNPWGLDFDDNGQAFITNCVIAHAWHVVPGARFQRMFGQDFNEHSYALMATCADHLHWAGGAWQEARGGERHDSYGGGHAHVGAMVYLGDNWPDEYRNCLYTCNLHGNRVNRDSLQRRGSGYVARHEADVLLANDPWFRGMSVKYGPDGGVYVSDWSDTGECHNYETVDRTNGRIYKVTHGHPRPWNTDLESLDDNALLSLLDHKNDWVVRHARRILQERASQGRLSQTTPEALGRLLCVQSTAPSALRILWALHAVGAANEGLLLACMDSPHDVVRGWAVQLELEDQRASPEALDKLATMAQRDQSQWVRLALAAALQRLPLGDRWAIARQLVCHAEDVEDANIPLMLWYGIEPLVSVDTQRALSLAERSQIPLIAQYIVRRMAASDDGALAAIVEHISRGDHSFQAAALTGLLQAVQVRRRVAMPDGWQSLYARMANSADKSIQLRSTRLGLIFGDPQALVELRKKAVDERAEAATRRQAIRALTQVNASGLSPFLQPLLTDRTVRVAALRGLASAYDAATARCVLDLYLTFDAASRREAVSTLASRREYAVALLEAMEKGVVPSSDLTAFHVQQLQSLQDEDVSRRLTTLWGEVRPTRTDRAAKMAQMKERLTPTVLASADFARGRVVFEKTCATCHRLFDAGGRVGPELTGSQRTNIDYVLSNVLDPSAIVAKDFQITVLELVNGRVLSGIVAESNNYSVTVQTANERLIVPRDEIEASKPSAISMMPDGLLDPLSESDARDLIGYLASPHQVPLPAKHPPAGSDLR